MLAGRDKRLGETDERGEDCLRLGPGDPPEQGRLVFELAASLVLLGQLLKGVQRGGAFGIAEDGRDGRDALQTMYLVAGYLEDGHSGEFAGEVAVSVEESLRGRGAGGLLDPCVVPGEEDACGHALDVPLEGSADGLVEVVDIEDEAAIGSAVGSEILDVGVAAELG